MLFFLRGMSWLTALRLRPQGRLEGLGPGPYTFLNPNARILKPTRNLKLREHKVVVFCLPTSKEDEAIVEQAKGSKGLGFRA